MNNSTALERDNNTSALIAVNEDGFSKRKKQKEASQLLEKRISSLEESLNSLHKKIQLLMDK